VRAKEIAINQASGASSNDQTRLGVAEEITQLYNQAVAIANRRIGDRYIFGGYKIEKPPVDVDGRYHGDDGQSMVEIVKDVFLTMNVPGIDAFNTNPRNSNDAIKQTYERQNDRQSEVGGRKPASTPPFDITGTGREENVGMNAKVENVNVFDEIQNLRISLLTGDLDGIRNTLERFDQIHGKLIATRAKVGSRMQSLDNANGTLERHNLTNADLSSSIEDADMAQVVSDLAKEETVFRSALASSHKLIQPTLLDFLK
jgi:flagellar hook-associated protein 3 FlgL